MSANNVNNQNSRPRLWISPNKKWNSTKSPPK